MLVVVLIWAVAMVCVAAGGHRVRRVLTLLWTLARRRVVRPVLGPLLRPLVGRLGPRLAPLHRHPETPAGRPFEAVAHDVQRLGVLFHHSPPHLSFARWEGRRRAYDVVLGEACRALDVAHLLHVLPPGPELDRERQRVESILEWSGLRLDDVA